LSTGRDKFVSSLTITMENQAKVYSGTTGQKLAVCTYNDSPNFIWQSWILFLNTKKYLLSKFLAVIKYSFICQKCPHSLTQKSSYLAVTKHFFSYIIPMQVATKKVSKLAHYLQPYHKWWKQSHNLRQQELK